MIEAQAKFDAEADQEWLAERPSRERARLKAMEGEPMYDPVGRIWQVLSGPGFDFIGVLVSEGDNPNRILAWMPVGGPDEADKMDAIGTARKIVREGHRASQDVWDCTNGGFDFGRMSSTRELPSEIYGSTAVPLADDWTSPRAVKLFPFCRVRMQRMIEEFQRLELSSKLREYKARQEKIKLAEQQRMAADGGED